MNQSKIRDRRFWKMWDKRGAVGRSFPEPTPGIVYSPHVLVPGDKVCIHWGPKFPEESARGHHRYLTLVGSENEAKDGHHPLPLAVRAGTVFDFKDIIIRTHFNGCGGYLNVVSEACKDVRYSLAMGPCLVVKRGPRPGKPQSYTSIPFVNNYGEYTVREVVGGVVCEIPA